MTLTYYDAERITLEKSKEAMLGCSLPASTWIPEFTRTPENRATTIFSGIRVGICITTYDDSYNYNDNYKYKRWIETHHEVKN